MIKANLPTEMAHEPEEEARQPLTQNMPAVPNRERKTCNISFADDQKPDSQSTSSYKDALSQPADCMSHRQRLLWVQQRRAPGLWAQCDDCNRWRYLPTVLDRHDLPKKWFCRMNPDSTFASCSAPEIPIRIHDEEDLIYSEYTAGSLVVARMDGWPWWPAMVDDCPDTEQYYWLDGFSDIPTHYHVVFFDALEATRAWLTPSQLNPYKDGKKLVNTSVKKSLRKRLETAIKQASEAEKLSQKERLMKYSFIARYKGDIVTPKKVNRDDIQKYQKHFKRRFAVALPDELSDFENDHDQLLSEPPRKRNVITIGSKKPKVVKDNEVEPAQPSNQSMVVEVDTNSDLPKATFTNTNVESSCGRTWEPTALLSQENSYHYLIDGKGSRPSVMRNTTQRDNTVVTGTSTTYAPDTTVSNTVEESHEPPDHASSPGSGDFDF